VRKKLIALSLSMAVLTTCFGSVISQTQQQIPSAETPKSSLVLNEDTPIRLRLSQNLSSGTSKKDDKVDFEVLEDIKVGDMVVISQGSVAIATVTEAHPKKSFGRSGKLNVNIDYVRLTNGDKVALRAMKGGKGGSRTGVMTGAVVATAIVFFPAAPLFFFIKGKNIEIPKGTEITAFVAADTPIDPTKFASKQDSAPSVAPQQPSTSAIEPTGLATVEIKSNPDASDITLNGKFVGSTTSTLQLAVGEHTILIEKSGFKPWQRTITVTGNGKVTVDATLEKLL
jgi:hypothetical protein